MDDRGNAAPAGQEDPRPLDQGAYTVVYGSNEVIVEHQRGFRVIVRDNKIIIDRGDGAQPVQIELQVGFRVIVSHNAMIIERGNPAPAVQVGGFGMVGGFRVIATKNEIIIERENTAKINLMVEDENGGTLFFAIKRSSQLQKLMDVYCEKKSIDFNSIAFLFDERPLRGDQTPNELEMENGDEILAMLR